MNIYKNSAKPYYFLVKDTFIVSNNPIRFRLNLLERIKKIMTIDDKIKYNKLQYDIKKESAKILALSSEKIDKYEYLQEKKYYFLIKIKC